MDKVLVVTSSDKTAESLAALIRECGDYDISMATSGPLARRMVLEEEWDTVVVNHPLKDDDAERFVQMLSEHSDASPILLVKGEFIQHMTKALHETPTLLVEKPVLKQVLHQSLILASSMKRRMEVLKAQNAKLLSRLDDMKFINKAKIAMIINEGLTEEQAHSKLERMAMDSRISKREAAKSIIRLYSD